MSESSWPDCGNVQCRRSHELLDTIIQMLGIEPCDDVYAVGKAMRISQAISKLQKCRELLAEYVAVDIPNDAAPLVGTLPQRAKVALYDSIPMNPPRT